MSVEWSYYNKFDYIDDKYLPPMGEGETKATQIVTAIAKLVYKWYNDGDVFDNTYNLKGWANDLSSYANWLDMHTTDRVSEILHRIDRACSDDDYEELLKDLTDELEVDEYLEEMDKCPAVGSIYECDGDFKFEERW